MLDTVLTSSIYTRLDQIKQEKASHIASKRGYRLSKEDKAERIYTISYLNHDEKGQTQIARFGLKTNRLENMVRAARVLHQELFFPHSKEMKIWKDLGLEEEEMGDEGSSFICE